MSGYPLALPNYFVEMGYNDYLVVKTESTAAWACVGIIDKIGLTFITDLILIGIPKEIRGLVFLFRFFTNDMI